MSVTRANVLDVLSADILELVLDEVKKENFRSIKTLRLVSKAMNELAETRTFASIIINFDSSSASYIEHQLSTLASGNSPATRWTKRLTILFLEPVDFGYGMLSLYKASPGQEGAKMTMLGCRDKYLLPAIQALRNVEVASFMVQVGPSAKVLRALAELPKLQDLSLTFGTTSSEGTMPLETFSNLRVLRLASLPTCAATLQLIGRMVARCPALEEMTLENDTDEPYSTNLDTIFNASMHSPSFVPSLTKLRVMRNMFILSATSVPYLRSLLHLDLQIHAGKIEASFWQALAQNGVQIRYFAVYPLDIAAVRYLTSYEGLTELHILGHRGMEARDCPDEVFHTALSHHRKSLRKLTFRDLDFQCWSITDKYLECVLKCQGLETLSLLYHHPDDMLNPWPALREKLSPDLSILLTRVTESLTRLKTLRICPTRQCSPFAFAIGFGMGAMTMEQSFQREIGAAAITCSRTPTFQLYGASHSFALGQPSPAPLAFDPSSRCFKPVKAEDDSSFLAGLLNSF